MCTYASTYACPVRAQMAPFNGATSKAYLFFFPKSMSQRDIFHTLWVKKVLPAILLSRERLVEDQALSQSPHPQRRSFRPGDLDFEALLEEELMDADDDDAARDEPEDEEEKIEAPPKTKRIVVTCDGDIPQLKALLKPETLQLLKKNNVEIVKYAASTSAKQVWLARLCGPLIHTYPCYLPLLTATQ